MPPGRKALHWFRALPAWAKVVVILILVGLLPWLLIAAGLTAAVLGLLGLLRGPLPRWRISSRPVAAGALLLGLVGLGTGSALAVAVVNSPSSSTAPTRPPAAAVRLSPATTVTTR